MALLCRSSLLCKSLQGQLSLKSALHPQMCSRLITMKVEKAQQEAAEDFDLRNIRIGRPQSPHLTIYAPQMTSMLSISHRITGAALSTYMIALGVGYLALPNDINQYATMIEGMNLSPALLISLKFLVAFPVCYHWCNGIRHLTWDTGRFLTNKGVYSTGYAMLAASAALSAIVTAL